MSSALLSVLTAALLPLVATSCRAQGAGDEEARELRVDSEIRILKVTYDKSDIPFWVSMIGQEVIPGLFLESIQPQKDCGDHVHAVFVLKSADSPEDEQEQPKAAPEPQRDSLQERYPSALA